MNDNQFETIASLFAGLQMAVVHLSNVVSQRAGIDKESLAASFEETAQRLPANLHNREFVVLPMYQIARGLRDSKTAAPLDQATLQRILN